MQILVGQYALALIKPETWRERQSPSKREGDTHNSESTDQILITQVTRVGVDTSKNKQHLFSKLVFGKHSFNSVVNRKVVINS